MPNLDHLTASQRQAVEHQDGALLVLAGPGSGKTRVITYRIARMVDGGIDPRQILAITFTNKAANELATRVAGLVPDCGVTVGTFHRFCARLLRQRAEAVGIMPNFSIIDAADQKQVVRQVLQELNYDTVHFPPARILNRISSAKNKLQSADDYARAYESSTGDYLQAVTARVYPKYQQLLLQSNSVDFDDLLLHVVSLLEENPELRADLDLRYRYVLVDEYQDTNLAQYRIVAALSRDYLNLCATGDPDQSIYGWRGAQIDNILRFEADFPQATVVRLEHNFRSTGRILSSADRLISHNVQRKAKALMTDNPLGEPVELLRFSDGKQEADAIVREIRRLVDSGDRAYSDFAVFYRVNALSREMEQALARHGVPFQVAAGVAFYERAEVKDMLAYLRLACNPNDHTAFMRIVNKPARGIGKTTQSRLAAWASAEHLTLLDAAESADKHPQLSRRGVKALQRFAALIDRLSSAAEPMEQLLRMVLDATGYTSGWEDSRSEQDRQRLANVQELLTVAREYDRRHPDDGRLEEFLETTSLANEVDNLDQESGQVTLMTLHAAKGLEFPVVYVLAVEQDLIPHERSVRSGSLNELEEERRLLFVGMTRAMQRLYLTHTYQREFGGRSLTSVPSDFLNELEVTVTDYPASAADAGNDAGADSRRGAASFAGRSADNAAGKRALLTTAANLLNGANTEAKLPQGFAVGMEVRHPRYGLGTVIDLGGFAKRRTVTVLFRDSDHSETFVASKSPLQPVGER